MTVHSRTFKLPEINIDRDSWRPKCERENINFIYISDVPVFSSLLFSSPGQISQANISNTWLLIGSSHLAAFIGLARPLNII